MAQNSYFFNAVMQNGEYDREYQASDFARYFFAVLSTGLFHTDNVPAIQASVEAGTLNTVVTPGMAIMKGYLYENTTPVTLTHTLPEVSLDRIDRVVLRLDLRNAERTILLQVKEGVSATYPEAPELQRDDFIYEISLAQIRVRKNTTQLLQTDLVDERFKQDLCGLVHSLLTIPTTQFQEQWDLFFNGKSGEVRDAADAYIQQLTADLIDYEQQFNSWFANQQTEGFVMANEKGQANGIPILDNKGKVPIAQLPPMDYVPLNQKGAPNGVATLESGRIPNRQLGIYSPSNTLFIAANETVEVEKYTENPSTWRTFASSTIDVPGGFRVLFSMFLRSSDFNVETRILVNGKVASPDFILRKPKTDVTQNYHFDLPNTFDKGNLVELQHRITDWNDRFGLARTTFIGIGGEML